MSGIERFTVERARQIEVEGFDPAADVDQYSEGELLGASICYLMHALYALHDNVDDEELQSDLAKYWPWAEHWWKPTLSASRSVEKAGALAAAELDRQEAVGLA